MPHPVEGCGWSEPEIPLIGMLGQWHTAFRFRPNLLDNRSASRKAVDQGSASIDFADVIWRDRFTASALRRTYQWVLPIGASRLHPSCLPDPSSVPATAALLMNVPPRAVEAGYDAHFAPGV